jgi:uncharacterized membrane protein HdeD (DUF308 family)
MKGGNNMKDKKEMEMHGKHMGGHMKHKGTAMLILGALILLNVYAMKLGWGTFVGGVLVLGGVVKMLHSGGCCCKKK